KPRAAEALGSRGIGLAELLEELGLLLGGHANAGVSDRELDPVATVGDPARPQPDLAFLGELAGIAEEIEQYLPQTHGIDGEGAEFLVRFHQQTVFVLLSELTRSADPLADQGRELPRLRFKLKLARLNLGEIEHLVDEAKQVSTSAVHALQRLL